MNERTQNFQGIRLLLLMGIVFMHAGMQFIGTGWLICTFFFILSGFLYKHPKSISAYIKKKLLKTFPLYWICLLLYFFLFGFNVKLDVIPHIFLLHAYIPSISENALTSENFIPTQYYFKYLGPSWFLSSLLFCYLVAPLLYKLFFKIKRENILTILLILFLFIILLRNYSSYIIPDGYGVWAFYISPYFRVFEYALGMLLGFAIKDSPRRKIKGVNFISIAIITALVLYLRGQMSVLFISGIFLFLIYYIYMYKSTLMDIVFGNKIVVTLANYSLAIYLAHQPIWRYLFHECHVSNWISILGATVLSTLLGFLYAQIFKFISNTYGHKEYSQR